MPRQKIQSEEDRRATTNVQEGLVFLFLCSFVLCWMRLFYLQLRSFTYGSSFLLTEGEQKAKQTKPNFRTGGNRKQQSPDQFSTLRKRPNRTSTVSTKARSIYCRQQRPTVSKKDPTVSKKTYPLSFSSFEPKPFDLRNPGG